MSQPQMIAIPLSQLVLSPNNVRKKPEGIDEMAADLMQHNQLQNLIVTKGKDGKYNVEAGGQRFRAFKKNEEDKKIQPDHPVWCLVVESGNATELSLAENFQRVPMHPADQFEAFQKLHDDGKHVGDIASAFGIDERFVRQRLSLAKVAPSLIKVYRDGGMDLEMLQAFTLAKDKKAQEQLWKGLHDWQRNAQSIRNQLTKNAVKLTSDHFAKFVGVDRYQAAGGKITTDLFSKDAYLSDPALVERLAGFMLEDAAVQVRAEGWNWVEIVTNGFSDWGYGKKKPKIAPTTVEQDRELATLCKQIELLRAELQAAEDREEDTEEDWRHDEIDKKAARIAAIEADRRSWSDKAKTESGAVVELGEAGELTIHRGLIRAADAKKAAKAKEKEKARTAAGVSGAADADAPAPADVTEAMHLRLSAHRSAALQALVAQDPQVAMAVLSYEMLKSLSIASGYHGGSFMRLSVASAQPGLDGNGVATGFVARAALAHLVDKWRDQLPDVDSAADETSGEVALFRFLLGMSVTGLSEILAIAVAVGLTATRGKRHFGSDANDVLIDELVRAVDLDMHHTWSPNRALYLDLVSKQLAVDAVTEACGADKAKPMAGMKKADAAEAAEALLTGTGWLPPALRAPETFALAEAAPEAAVDTIKALLDKKRAKAKAGKAAT